jgi:opacity protein-like surface antigen
MIKFRVSCIGALVLSTLSLSTGFAASQVNNTSLWGSSWFFSGHVGASFPVERDTLYVDNGSGFPSPYNLDSYSVDQESSAMVNVVLGKRWTQNSDWLPAHSLGLSYQHQFISILRGDVMQNLYPPFLNYHYALGLTSDLVLATSKVNLFRYKQIAPYISGSLGVSVNHTSYRETALDDVTPRESPSFSANKNKLAFNLGAGLDYQITDSWIVTVGYLYQSFGEVNARGNGSWFGSSLDLGTYGAHEVLVGGTYLFHTV